MKVTKLLMVAEIEVQKQDGSAWSELFKLGCSLC